MTWFSQIRAYKSLIFLALGLILALFFGLVNPFKLDPVACGAISVAILMLVWWISEALPMAVVALLPLVLFPLLKIDSLEKTAVSYASPVVFLFLGGFMLGLAIEKWNLHKRIALSIIRITGTSGNRIVLGFIFATALLSMWLSNTATTMMMFPIALSVIKVMHEHKTEGGHLPHFSIALMFAIAYGSNIGGISTIIGTPPNVAYVSYYQEKYDSNIDFFHWMLLCVPLALTLLIALYWVLVRVLYPNRIQHSETAHAFVARELKELGPLTTPEKRVLCVFVLTASLWIFKSGLLTLFPGLVLDDNMIAIMAAILLFMIPSGEKKNKSKTPLLEWSDTERLPWGILLLFGGGISLAHALEKAGIMHSVGLWVSGFSSHPFMLLVLVVVLSVFMSELMSNVAQVMVFAPVVSVIADSLGMNPLFLGIPMTLSASCAGMLPMGTPPNAIAFSSGYIRLKDFLKAGFIMNLIAIGLIILFSWFVLPLVFGG